MPSTLLNGINVFLRRMEASDLERTYHWINNPELFVTMGVFGPRSKDAQREWFENISQSQSNIVFAVCRIEDEEHIGNASLFDIDLRNRNAGLTIMLPDNAVRGKGFGKETVRLLCGYAFDYLNLHKVYCKTDNPIAAKLYERIGFVQEGLFREHAYHYGKYVDKACYGILKKEFWSKNE